MNQQPNNPYESPGSLPSKSTAKGRADVPVWYIVVMSIVSLALGGCAFFCTCWGGVIVLLSFPGISEAMGFFLVLVLPGIAGIAAAITLFRLFYKLRKRKAQRMLDESEASIQDESVKS